MLVRAEAEADGAEPGEEKEGECDSGRCSSSGNENEKWIVGEGAPVGEEGGMSFKSIGSVLVPVRQDYWEGNREG